MTKIYFVDQFKEIDEKGINGTRLMKYRKNSEIVNFDFDFFDVIFYVVFFLIVRIKCVLQFNEHIWFFVLITFFSTEIILLQSNDNDENDTDCAHDKFHFQIKKKNKTRKKQTYSFRSVIEMNKNFLAF